MAGERTVDFFFFQAVAMTTIVKTVVPKQKNKINTRLDFSTGIYFDSLHIVSITWLYNLMRVGRHFTFFFGWCSERFPYFKANDDRWKNSVRHNLSISPHFRKSVKARTGTGHLWTLALPPSARTIAANLAVRKTHKKSNRSLTWTTFCDSKRPKRIMSSRNKFKMKWPGLVWNFSAPKDRQLFNRQNTNHLIRFIQRSIHLEFCSAINLIIWQDDRNSPLTFERAAELMLAESGAGNCEGRVHVEFLARPLQLLAHMENGSCSPGNWFYTNF